MRSWSALSVFLLSACSLDELKAGDPNTPEPSQCADRAADYCSAAGGAFCADFEETDSTYLEDNFAVVEDDEGHIGLVSDGGCDGSAGLRVSLDHTLDPGCRYTRIHKSLTGTFDTATVAADLFTGTAPTGAGFSRTRMLSIGSASASVGFCVHFLWIQEGKVVLHTQRHQVFDDMLELDLDLPRGRWTRVEMTLEDDDGVARASILFDGQPALPPLRFEKCGAGEDLQLHVGVHCGEPEGTTMSADNLLVTLE